ncbi:hypothetical protein UFOVP325_81 [uncultured Caudovirales phage]|uniref:Uncharacterized protein n=1 Tax=uncultured Caudovirales phage TaxID=2100421 RepID=A0A6J5MSV1_9CAUD|nr:hypothetical protein UFOVP325_81 [uncultured Caudovirales phage]CAB4148020.1 hypothetical protein UFOVP430_76 [uncultured Caudovirales phage]
MGLARAENPDNVHSDVEQDRYTGPDSGGTSYQKEYRTSFQTAGGSFTTKGLTGGGGNRVIGLSGQSRSSLVNWDSGATSSPGFTQ